MVTVDIDSEIGADGMLRIALPASFRNKKVKACISIDPHKSANPDEEKRSKVAVMALFGTWQGELVRGDQGEYQDRESLD